MDKNKIEHGFHQEANNWIMCKCGKIFSDSRKGKVSKVDKLKYHIMENG